MNILNNSSCTNDISFHLRKNDHYIQGSLIIQDQNNFYNFYGMVCIYHFLYNILIGIHHNHYMIQNKMHNFQGTLSSDCLVKHTLFHSLSNLIYNLHIFNIPFYSLDKYFKGLKSNQICKLNIFLENQNKLNNFCHISYKLINH